MLLSHLPGYASEDLYHRGHRGARRNGHRGIQICNEILRLARPPLCFSSVCLCVLCGRDLDLFRPQAMNENWGREHTVYSGASPFRSLPNAHQLQRTPI